MTDMEILQKALEKENDPRNRLPPAARNWEMYSVGANRADINRLLEGGMIRVSFRSEDRARLVKYKLTDKGRGLVAVSSMENESKKIPASDILDAMSLVIGFDDIKQAIAQAVASQRRINFLLEGPPACAKSVLLEGVRSSVSSSYMAFGSRTSASGLSDVLFEHQPKILLLDEADKIHMDVYAVLLGLMEKGEILETKQGKTRGIVLQTMVLAACNGSQKMPREFLSRFALHVHFPAYTRQEFIDVCHGFLSRSEGCPDDLAQLIGEQIYDNQIGDVRKARGAWQLMTAPTQEEVERVIRLMVKYSTEPQEKRRQKSAQQSLL
jgi:DNA-binding MarR family transcriptional regulator